MKTILHFSSNTAAGLTSRGGVRSHLFFWTTLILIQKDSCCAYLYFSSCTMQISESTCCCIIHNLNHCTFVLGGRSTVHYCRSHDNSLIFVHIRHVGCLYQVISIEGLSISSWVHSFVQSIIYINLAIIQLLCLSRIIPKALIKLPCLGYHWLVCISQMVCYSEYIILFSGFEIISLT